MLILEIFEDGAPPRFRARFDGRPGARAKADDPAINLETERPDGARQLFAFADRGGYLESLEEIPEPHAFTARVELTHGDHTHDYTISFTEHDAAAETTNAAERDNNMRAAFIHVMADAAVSVLAILGLSAGKFLGWVFMDPVMGIVGAG